MTPCVVVGERLVGLAVVLFALAEAFVIETVWPASGMEFK